MKESLIQPVSVQALRGVNQTPSERLDEFTTLQNVAPDAVGKMTRILGKHTIEKVAGPVMTIHQFWNAYGYGARLRQTSGGVISDPEPPDDPGFKDPIDDGTLGCKPVPVYSNKLKLQYIDRRSDFIEVRYQWNRCAGTDFDSRTSLIECSIPGVPVFTGVSKTAIVGFFTDGTVLDFIPSGQRVLSLGADNTYPFESVIIDLAGLRALAGNVAFTAKFQMKGYFYSYISSGNVVLNFRPWEKGKTGTYARNLSLKDTSWQFFGTVKRYRKKSWKANIVTQTMTPTLTTGDHICYLYVKFHPKAQAKKDRIWIDDV